MTFKDRTVEFNSVAENLRHAKKTKIVSSSRSLKQERTQFTILASQISRDLRETTEKLDQLTKLAKSKSLFNESKVSIEIQELTSIVNQDIKNLNNQISILQQYKNSRKNKQAGTHSDTIIDTLKSKLKTTTKEFSQVLEMRTENIKAQQKEKETLTGNSLGQSLGRKDSPLYKSPTSLSNFIENPQSNTGDITLNMPNQQQALQVSNRLIASRAEAVLSIERTITELQSIFQQLAHLVAEQGELIERIDDNISNTSANVEGAQAQLLRYLNNIKSNRWLAFKMFAILILFIIIFVLFFI